MIPIVAAAQGASILSKIFGGQSAAFLSRQSVRDQFYLTLREAGKYFESLGTVQGTVALATMNRLYSDLSPSRDYGKIGPTSTHLAQLNDWLANLDLAVPATTGAETGTIHTLEADGLL